jgi:membrane fusion protein (multidrug efflux system)
MGKRSRFQYGNAIVIIGTAVLGIAGCDNKTQANAPSFPPVDVEVITTSAGKAVINQDLPGRLSAVRSAQVRARVEGVIEKQLFIEGSDVRAGAPLYQIDPRTFQASATAADAAVASARAVVDRYAPLLAIKAVSQQEFDSANAQLKLNEALQAKARLDLDNATPKAPISGRIGRSNVTEGSLTGKDAGTHLVTIEQLDPIRVDFVRYYSDVLRLQQAIKAGRQKRADATAVELLQEDGSVYPEKGTLRFSDMAVDPSTGAILLRAEFPNPRHELLPGTFVGIRFPQSVLDEAIRVPQRAVTASAQGQTIMVVDSEGKAQLRAVKTSGTSGGDFIVSEGLKAGEQVIITGLQKLHPGSAVKALPWQAEQPLTLSATSASSVAK